MGDVDLLIGIRREPLRIEEVDDYLRDERAGAICIFTGTTRRWTGGSETIELAYEAYSEMAETVLGQLAERASNRWSLSRVGVLHRIGRVPIAEPSVIVGVSAPHRAEAFEACRWLIDTLKTEVPIWKKERYADGRSEWVDPAGPRNHPDSANEQL